MDKIFIKSITTGEIKYPVTVIENVIGFEENVIPRLESLDYEIEKLNDEVITKIEADKKYLSIQNVQDTIKNEVQSYINELDIFQTININMKDMSDKLDNLSDMMEKIIQVITP